MSTERIDIQITETGARRVKRSIEDIGDSASGTERALSLLKRALGALGVAAFLRSLVQTADAFTNMQNQLRLVTTSQAQLAVVTDELFAISQRTRASMEGTAEVYAKVARNANTLGLSQVEVLGFTESLNQAIALSGSTAQQAEAGIRQLGQAIGSGALRGDELNSILENTSEVAAVIAKGMGVPIGQIRKLGAEGKITADKIVESFAKAREELAERFAKTVPTVAQSVQVLQNAWTKFIGELDSSTGITRTIAQGIIWIANNMETLARIAAVASIAIGVHFAINAVGAAITAIRALTAAGAATPWGAIITLIAAASAALLIFSDRIKISADGLVTLADYGTYAWSQIKKGLDFLATYLGDTFDQFRTWASETFGFMADESLSFPRTIAQALDRVLGRFAGFAGAIVAVWNQVKANLAGHTGVSLADALTKGWEDGVKSIGKPAESFLDDLINGAQMASNSRIEREAAAENARRRALEAMNQKGTAAPAVAKDTKGPTFTELLQSMAKEGELLNYNLQQRQAMAEVLRFEEQLKRSLTQAELEQVSSLAMEIDSMKLRADTLEALQQPSMQYIEQTKALNEVMKESPALTEMATQALANLEIQFLSMQEGGTFVDGYIRQLRIMQLETRNAMADMGAEIAGIFGPGGSMVKGVSGAVATSIVNFKEYRSQMEEAFRDSDGNLTRHFGFWDVLGQKIKDVARSILEQLISALIQMGINMAINAALGNTLAATATAASIAQAAAIGTAWATPAALVNAATFGAGAAAGTTALVASVGVSKGLTPATGFAEGGYTGDQGRTSIAGVVHGQEYVLNAQATSRIGRSNLDRMNSGYGMFGQMPNMNVTVVNRDIPGAEFQVNQLSPTDVEIIAKRVVATDAPNVIANDMQNPSGRVSRAVTGTTNAKTKR